MIIILIILALVLQGFFSGTEAAFISLNSMKLRHRVEKKEKRAQVAYRLLLRPDRLLATTLVGTNIAVVTSSVLATFLFTQFFGEKGAVIAVFVMLPLTLIFGEIIPKTVFRERANRVVLRVAPLLDFFQGLLKPAVFIVSGIAKSLVFLVNPKGIRKNPFVTREEIKLLVREIAREGILEEQEKEVINSIFDFTLTRVEDIMTPFKKVIYVDYTESQESIKKKSKEYGFTRLLVFKNRKLLGMINIFDLFYNTDDWRKHIRPLRKVGINEKLDTMFSQMQPNKESIAAVIKNEKVVGIFTMEDLMEEVICGIYEQKEASRGGQDQTEEEQV